MAQAKYIVGDWGGTNLRVALSTSEGTGEFYKYACSDFSSAEDIFNQVYKDMDISSADIDGFVIAAAGPVNSPDHFIFPNNTALGVINFSELGKSLGTKIILLNDFSAQAYGTLGLEKEDFEKITPDIADKKLPKELWEQASSPSSIIQVPPSNRFLLIGPGTGLGVCTLGVAGPHITVIDGEGGHTNFATCSDEEHDVLEKIRSKIGVVSHEGMASGIGLANIFRAITNNWDQEVLPERVTQAAKEGDADAKETVRLFTIALGRAAGNAALLNQTRGGIILPSGSIVSALGEHFDTALFSAEIKRNDFNNNPDNVSHNPASGTPVYIMRKEETGIIGAHIYAQSLG